MYYQNAEAFRHFITWRQRYHPRKFHFSIYSFTLILIIIISQSAGYANSEKVYQGSYDDRQTIINVTSTGTEHNRRHGHKYYQNIDSLLNSLKNSRSGEGERDPPEPPPQLPDSGGGGGGGGGSSGEGEDGETTDTLCPTCYYEKNSDVIRLEAIKRQILSKLGLKQKPNIKLPVPREVVIETLVRAGDYMNDGESLGHEEDGDKKKKKKKEQDSEDEMSENEPDDFYGRTSEIISFAEPGQPLNGQTLLEFTHSSDTEPGVVISQLRVKSAVLWVRIALNRSLTTAYKFANKNLTLWVFKVKQSVANTSFLSGKDFDEHTELVGSLSSSLSNSGWLKIDLTSAVREWYLESSLSKEKLRLLVDCSGCRDIVQLLIFQRNKFYRNVNPYSSRRARSLDNQGMNQRSERTANGGYRLKFDYKFNEDLTREDYVKNISSHNDKLDPNRPFLVVHTEPAAMKRSRRRALDCSGAVKGQCCKQNFFVSFKELNWDDWIIAPKGYHANYCRGNCGGIHRTPDTFLNYHTHVIEEYRKLDKLSGIQPCCAPVKFSSMSLIYFGPDNNIIKRDLPKMVVEQCGCP